MNHWLNHFSASPVVCMFELLHFIKEEINRLFRGGRLTASEAREYSDEAESSEDIKKTVYNLNFCINQHPHFRYSDKFTWPEVDNPEYKTLCYVFDAVWAPQNASMILLNTGMR